MKQKQYTPLSVGEEAVSLFAVGMGYLDDVDVHKVGDFERALHSYMKAQRGDLMDRISGTGDYNDEIEGALHSALKDFKAHQVW
jgi:F-type H+-transporting ATPase subunit alpha